MKYDKELLNRYLAGETTPEEERALREAAKQEEAARPSAEAAYSRLVAEQKAVKAPLSDDELFARLPAEEAVKEKPDAGRQPLGKQKSFHIPPVVFQLAAAFALLLLGYWFGRQVPGTQPPQQLAENQSNEQLVALQNEMSDIKDMLLQNNSAGQRLQAVQQVNYLPNKKADAELISVLIYTMNFDENVNVRIASIEALQHFADRPIVRKALTNSLKIQTNPSVQIQLIETLVQNPDSTTIPTLQEVLSKPDLQEAVRQQLEVGIGKLI